jgi:hypothetical protein
MSNQAPKQTGFCVTVCTPAGPFGYYSSKRLVQSAFLDCVLDHQRQEPNAPIISATIAPEYAQLHGDAYWDMRVVLSQGA